MDAGDRKNKRFFQWKNLQKRWEIRLRLLLTTNRKWHTSFQMKNFGWPWWSLTKINKWFDLTISTVSYSIDSWTSCLFITEQNVALPTCREVLRVLLHEFVCTGIKHIRLFCSCFSLFYFIWFHFVARVRSPSVTLLSRELWL